MKKVLALFLSICVTIVAFIFSFGTSFEQKLISKTNNLNDKFNYNIPLKKYSAKIYKEDNPFDYNYYIYIKDVSSGKKYRHININNINAVNIAVAEFQEEYNDKKGTAEAEKGFLKFIDFYRTFLGEQSVIEQEAQDLIQERSLLKYEEVEKLPPIEDTLRMKYEKYGININHDEGYFYVTRNFQYIYDNFAPYLTTEWQELFKFNAKYQCTIISDAHFTINKNDIKEIISFYKNFKIKYPDFCKKHLNIDKVIESFEKGLLNYPCAAY